MPLSDCGSDTTDAATKLVTADVGLVHASLTSNNILRPGGGAVKRVQSPPIGAAIACDTGLPSHLSIRPGGGALARVQFPPLETTASWGGVLSSHLSFRLGGGARTRVQPPPLETTATSSSGLPSHLSFRPKSGAEKRQCPPLELAALCVSCHSSRPAHRWLDTPGPSLFPFL